MKKHLITAFLMTIATTILLGVIYPLLITALAQVLFKDKANGQLITRNGEVIGSRIIAQPFTSAKYFHPRPSAAGNGYDAANSGGTNFAPTNQKLIDRIQADAKSLHEENPASPFPWISSRLRRRAWIQKFLPRQPIFKSRAWLASAAFPNPQFATWSRSIPISGIWACSARPRVNVLELNLALDDLSPKP